MDAAELAQWTPIRLSLERPDPIVDWCDLRGIAFREPFFLQTVARWAADRSAEADARPVIRTTLATLEAVDGEGECLAPSGFIFHMSRCGSTLLSRLFGLSPDTIVLSEPDPINALLEADPSLLNEASLIACIRLMVRALGRKRLAAERHYIIKFSSWNVRRLRVLRAAFPEVPWVFVFRRPVEVMSSVLAGRPGWMHLQGDPPRAAHLLGIPAEDCGALSAEAFCARGLASFCSAALAGDDGRTLFIDYQDLPAATWDRVADLFKMTLSGEQVAAMQAEAQFYAKDVAPRPFVADAAQKRVVAPEIAALADAWLGALYEEMRARRARPPAL